MLFILLQLYDDRKMSGLKWIQDGAVYNCQSVNPLLICLLLQHHLQVPAVHPNWNLCQRINLSDLNSKIAWKFLLKTRTNVEWKNSLNSLWNVLRFHCSVQSRCAALRSAPFSLTVQNCLTCVYHARSAFTYQ